MDDFEDDFDDDFVFDRVDGENEEDNQPVNPDNEAIESPDEDAKKLEKARKAAKKHKTASTKKRRVFNELDLVGNDGYRKLFTMVRNIKLPKETGEISSSKFRKDITEIEDKIISWASELQPNMKFSEFCEKCQMLNKKRVVLDCIRGLIAEFYPGIEWRIVDDDMQEIKDFEKKYTETDEYFRNYIGAV